MEDFGNNIAKQCSTKSNAHHFNTCFPPAANECHCLIHPNSKKRYCAQNNGNNNACCMSNKEKWKQRNKMSNSSCNGNNNRAFYDICAINALKSQLFCHHHIEPDFFV